MSDERREKIELSVSWGCGAGSIQCEADGTPNAMRNTVQKLVAAFVAAWPTARAALSVPEQNQPEAVASAPEPNAYASGYNRAITDAHNAMAYEFGHASQDPNGIRAQAAIRRLYKPVAAVPTPDEEKAQPTLEKQCSDALDEYAAFRVMGGEAKTLPERIRLLGDSWQRVKAAHAEAEEQVSRLLAEATKREMAIRDAALEEAVTVMGNVGLPPLDEWMKTIEAIRARKSKPAPVLTPDQVRELDERRESREEAARKLDALVTSNVHDFGWALAQMRAGKKVRRPHWHTSCHLAWRENSVWDIDQVGRSNYKPFSADWGATDWEVAE